MKIRGGFLFSLFLVVVLLLLGWVAVRMLGGGALGAAQTSLPLELQRLIPSRWTVLAENRESCSFDSDPEEEWLVIYRYDDTEVADPFHRTGRPTGTGPIGGVVFDAQPAFIPEGAGNPGLYRPTILVPYKLLPDYYTGKGQGYLGESRVEVVRYPQARTGAGCQAEELYILGYSDGTLPTRVSAFRWSGVEEGYRVQHFVGNARVSGEFSGTAPLDAVTTYNRLENHRSRLCEVRRYVRARGPGAGMLQFGEATADFSIDFCYEAPRDPAYPEGVVVALLRGKRPSAPTGATVLPTRDSYLTASYNALPGLDLSQAPFRILSVSHRATVSADPAGGFDCTPDDKSYDGPHWWCARERAEVFTDVMVGAQLRRVTWSLMSISDQAVNADVVWRVEWASWGE